ncbi:transposase [Lactiplantibacillus argentoratensis]|uniref:transposase n=1 Tax=Lactiplantibacillus argentoratensis TaxID=271881 RepID=UPI0030B896DD
MANLLLQFRFGLILQSTTYFSDHSLTDALRTRNYLSFIKTLEAPGKISLKLEETIKTYYRHLSLIQNMMESTYSNGPVEGINRKIKQIKRTAYGYKNWPHFYTRIRIEFTIKIEKKKPIRK